MTTFLDRGYSIADQAIIYGIFKILFKPQKNCGLQCQYALETFRHDDETCYLCCFKIPPHEISIDGMPSTFFISVPTTSQCSPQCEHIIPCNSKTINPYLLMLMIGTNYTSFFGKKATILKQMVSNPASRIDESNIKSMMKQYKSKPVQYFFNIIIRINYAWSHRSCNNFKTNKDFIKLGTKYEIDDTEVDKYASDFFTSLPNKFTTELQPELISKTMFGKIPKIYSATHLPTLNSATPLVPLKNNSIKSINSRLGIITKVLNDSKYKKHISHALSITTPFLSSSGGCRFKKKYGGVNLDKYEIKLIEVLILLIEPDNQIMEEEITHVEDPYKLSGGSKNINYLYLTKLNNEVSMLENKLERLTGGKLPCKRPKTPETPETHLKYIIYKIAYLRKITSKYIEDTEKQKEISQYIEKIEHSILTDKHSIFFIYKELLEYIKNIEQYINKSHFDKFKKKYVNFMSYFFDENIDADEHAFKESLTGNYDINFYFKNSVLIDTFNEKFDTIINAFGDKYKDVTFRDVCRLAFTWLITGSNILNDMLKKKKGEEEMDKKEMGDEEMGEEEMGEEEMGEEETDDE